MSSDEIWNLESRLQQQLSNRAAAFPLKPDRLDVVRARGRRRQSISLSVLVLAGFAGLVAVFGLAAGVLSNPSESTFAVGRPNGDATVERGERRTALQVEDRGHGRDRRGDDGQPVDSATGDDMAGANPDGGSDKSAEGVAGFDLEDQGPMTTGPVAGLSVPTFAPPRAAFDGACLPAPPLPAVSVTDPGKRVVRIGSEAELQAAAQNLSSNTVLLLAPGTYELSRTLWVQVDDVTIRGDSDRCDDVVLVGRGMENAAGRDSVPHGVWTDRSNVKVQNLTIRDVYFHAITVNGGGHAPEIYNVGMIDAGEQFVKINPIGFGEGVDDGVVDYAAIKYTNGPPTTDHGGGIGYTQGVDIHAGDGWTIQNSRFENFHTPDDADHLWSPVVLAWNGHRTPRLRQTYSSTLTELSPSDSKAPDQVDHSGGVIRNNMIMNRPGLFSASRAAQSDAPIIVWNSPGTKVLHNTVATRGNHNKSIELRFTSDGIEVRNNLVDAPISDRDNGDYVESNNVTFDDGLHFPGPRNR